MTDNELYIYIDSSGNIIKTSKLELNQYSTNNVIKLVTIGNFASVKVSFLGTDKKISDAYHMVFKEAYALTENDTESVLKENADNLFLYEFLIPVKITSDFVSGSSSRLAVSFSCFNEKHNYLNNATTANSYITVKQASIAPNLDSSYSAADVENLWKDNGVLHVTKYDKSGGTIDGDVHIAGDLEVDGDTTLNKVNIDELHVTDLTAENIDATTVEATDVSANTVVSNNGEVTRLVAHDIENETLRSEEADIDELSADNIEADTITVQHLDAKI